jgi:hypothetical protein
MDKPRLDQGPDYERGFIDGMMYQTQSSVDKAVNQMAQPEKEPLEYWNAVEGWVKIDEVREHFESVSCGTIYKHEGEGRVPLYTSPPQRTWVGLTEEDLKLLSAEWRIVYGAWMDDFARDIEAKLKEKNT